MRVYVCLYRNQKLLIEAETTYAAQQEAARRLRVKEKQRYQITVYLADQPISTASL